MVIMRKLFLLNVLLGCLRMLSFTSLLRVRAVQRVTTKGPMKRFLCSKHLIRMQLEWLCNDPDPCVFVFCAGSDFKIGREEALNIFQKFDQDGSGMLSRHDFLRGLRNFPNSAERLRMPSQVRSSLSVPP